MQSFNFTIETLKLASRTASAPRSHTFHLKIPFNGMEKLADNAEPRSNFIVRLIIYETSPSKTISSLSFTL